MAALVDADHRMRGRELDAMAREAAVEVAQAAMQKDERFVGGAPGVPVPKAFETLRLNILKRNARAASGRSRPREGRLT